MANEIQVVSNIIVDSSVTGVTRITKIFEEYQDDLQDFDTPTDTGSTTIDTTVDDLDNEIGSAFIYVTGDIMIITNTGDTNYVDIGIEEQSSLTKVYFARLQPQQHMHMPIGPNFATTNMWAKTNSGTTTVRVTVVQTT